MSALVVVAVLFLCACIVYVFLNALGDGKGNGPFSPSAPPPPHPPNKPFVPDLRIANCALAQGKSGTPIPGVADAANCFADAEQQAASSSWFATYLSGADSACVLYDSPSRDSTLHHAMPFSQTSEIRSVGSQNMDDLLSSKCFQKNENVNASARVCKDMWQQYKTDRGVQAAFRALSETPLSACALYLDESLQKDADVKAYAATACTNHLTMPDILDGKMPEPCGGDIERKPWTALCTSYQNDVTKAWTPWTCAGWSSLSKCKNTEDCNPPNTPTNLGPLAKCIDDGAGSNICSVA